MNGNSSQRPRHPRVQVQANGHVWWWTMAMVNDQRKCWLSRPTRRGRRERHRHWMMVRLGTSHYTHCTRHYDHHYIMTMHTTSHSFAIALLYTIFFVFLLMNDSIQFWGHIDWFLSNVHIMLFASHLQKFFFEAGHVLNEGYLKDCRVLYWYRTAPPLANVHRFCFVELFSAHLSFMAAGRTKYMMQTTLPPLLRRKDLMLTQPTVHLASISFILCTTFSLLSFDCRNPQPVGGNAVNWQSVVPFFAALSNSHIEGCIVDFWSCKYILSKLKGIQQQDEVVAGQRYISAPEVVFEPFSM